MATISQWDLVSARYDMPAELRGFLFGDVTSCGDIEPSWHTAVAGRQWVQAVVGSQVGGSFKIKITNEYDVVLNLGPLGEGTRKG